MEILYQHKDHILNKADGFVYEIILYLVYKDRIELFDSKYIISKQLIKIKECEIKAVNKEYKQMKCIQLIAAPEKYLNENGYKAYEHYTKREINSIKRRKKKEFNK